MAGEVKAVGESVKHWKAGDRVCANFSTDHIAGDTDAEIVETSLGGQSEGVLTQYRSFPSHVWHLYIAWHFEMFTEWLCSRSYTSLPTSHMKRHPHCRKFSQEVPCNYLLITKSSRCAALTAYNALDGPTPLKAGDIVLVQGTGGVSMYAHLLSFLVFFDWPWLYPASFALQFAVASGATVIATSSSDAKLEYAKKLGATHVINYKKTPEWDEEVKKLVRHLGYFRLIMSSWFTLPWRPTASVLTLSSRLAELRPCPSRSMQPGLPDTFLWLVSWAGYVVLFLPLLSFTVLIKW